MATETTWRLPTGAATADGAEVLGALPASLPRRRIEPVGRFFQAYFNRRRHNRTITEQDVIDKSRLNKDEDEEDDTLDEPETADLLRLDPKYWKDQDHYAVLGLSRLRWRATEEDIKKAFRKKVLRHHPDKKAAQHNGRTDDDSFFKCIQKAYDLLMNPETRKHFDSVDPTFDENVPALPKKELKPEEFFKMYAPVFERNARFSKIQPVPLLGDNSATLAEVEGFYDFWYNFDSWRVFNYLDEEEGSGGDDKNRDDKRYLEKKNKKQREEKKTEDNKRIRRLTDQAQQLDPRIKRLRAEERERKQREKDAKLRAKTGAPAEGDKEAEEAAKAAAERAAAEKAAKEEEEKRQKLDKEAKKKAVQKERKTFRRIIKSRNFFMTPDTSADSADMLKAVESSERVVSDLPLEELAALNASMSAEPRGAWGVYTKTVAKLLGDAAVTPEPPYVEPVESAEAADEQEQPAKPTAKASEPKAAAKAPEPKAAAKAPEATKPAAKGPEPAKPKPAETPKPAEAPKPAAVDKAAEKKKAEPEPVAAEPAKEAKPSVPWTDKEVALLIEAVKKHPGGTINRWKKITDHINQHNPGAPQPKREKEVAEKVKAIQSATGVEVPTDTNIKIEKKHNDTVINDAPTLRDQVNTDVTSAAAAAASSSKAAKKAAKAEPPAPKKPTVEELILQDETWTKEQVRQLQEAMRKCPGDMDNRWDHIAELVEGKNKKECQSKAKKIQNILKELKNDE